MKNKIGIFNKRLLVSFLAAVTIATSLGMISLTFFPTYAYATEDSQDDSGQIRELFRIVQGYMEREAIPIIQRQEIVTQVQLLVEKRTRFTSNGLLIF